MTRRQSSRARNRKHESHDSTYYDSHYDATRSMESYHNSYERDRPGFFDFFINCTDFGRDRYEDDYYDDYERDSRDRYENDTLRESRHDYHGSRGRDISPKRSGDRDYSPPRRERGKGRGYESESSYTSHSSNKEKEKKKKDKKKSKSEKTDEKKSKKKKSKKDKKKKESTKEKKRGRSRSKTRSNQDVRDDENLTSIESKQETRDSDTKAQPRVEGNGYTLNQITEKVASMFTNGMPSVPLAPNPHQNVSSSNLVVPMNFNQTHEEPTISKTMAPMQRGPSSYSLNVEQRANAGAPFIALPTQVSNNNLYANQMHTAPQQVMVPQDSSNFHQQQSHQNLMANHPNASPTLANSSRQLQSTYHSHSQSQLQPQVSQRPLQPQPDPQPLQSQQDLNPKALIPSIISSDNALSDNMSAITMMKMRPLRKQKSQMSQQMTSEWAIRTPPEEMVSNSNFLEENEFMESQWDDMDMMPSSNFMRDDGFMEAIIPPGDMSIVLSSTPDGLMIERLSERSVARNALNVGDTIIALDGVDVSFSNNMT